MQRNTFFIFLSVLVFIFLSSKASAISMNFGGNFRTEGAYYSNLGQGITGTNEKKQYIRGRLLLDPNVVVDDHFSIKSQWSLLESPNFVPSATTALGAGQGGFVYGDVTTSALVLNRAWLEWTSDFGVVRLGRMPVSWGYGLLWDAGTGIWDDYGTTVDRLEYRLHLGNMVGALAYSKPRKRSLLGHGNDADFFTAYLQYNSPESEIEAGILYEKQSRSSGQVAELEGTATPSGNPYATPGNPYPLSVRSPSPTVNNIVDVYVKKGIGYFTIGGEVGWLTGDASDYGGLGKTAKLNALGTLITASYEYHKIKVFTEFLYATGDQDLTNGELTGFVLLHRNRQRAGLIFRELIGTPASAVGDNAGQGTYFAYGNTGAFSGVYAFRPGFRIDWSPSWASGIELIWAKKASTQSGEEAHIGTELDVGTDYSVYKNFDLGASVGFLFPGKGATNGADTKTIFGFHTTAALRF